MRLLILSLFSLVVFSACKEERKPVNESSDKVNEVVVEAPEIPENIEALDGAWNSYWQQFKEGVVKESKVYVMTLIHYPVYGTDGLSTKGNKDGLDEEEMKIMYYRLFDDNVRQKVAVLKATDVDSYQVGDKGTNEAMAQKLGLEKGSKVYYFTVGNTTAKDGKIVLDSSAKFYFGKLGSEGGYKLSWVEYSN
ncbi:MAG: hypothetical protein R2879_02780 [Saprospiraceae bacterium]